MYKIEINIICYGVLYVQYMKMSKEQRLGGAVAVAASKPLLKWVGGKMQIINDIMCGFPKEINNYHEPFIGGGSVLISFLTKVRDGAIKLTGKVYASDVNANLISFYKNIQGRPEECIDELRKLCSEYGAIVDGGVGGDGGGGGVVNRAAKNIEEASTSKESYYYWTRARFNALTAEERVLPKAAAMLLFLNKTCFRGLYREGPNGFNVPFGNNKNVAIIDEKNIRFVSGLIKDVIFTHCSFESNAGLAGATRGDFIYFDPPYAPETDTSFVGYSKDGFGIESHRALFRICGDMTKKGVSILMSNADVKMVKDAFPSPVYSTRVISCRRAIHSKEPDSRTNEVLITNM
jgi:DNA adenine methylase